MTAAPKTPLAAATEAQWNGSDPARSVFVAASAGSGKTKVLRDRVLRLMLEGEVESQRILCLTFTKAAAAEMSNRIATTLALWAAMPENDLRQEIKKLTDRTNIDDALIASARRLFARVLDAPGGMRIHTIHAFCQSLLRRFPLEAGIAPHFDLIEERDANELMAEARMQVLALAHSGKRQDLAKALEEAVARMPEGRLDDLLRQMLARRQKLVELRRGVGDVEAIITAIGAKLGLGKGESRQSIIEDASKDDAFAASDLRRAADALAASTATDQKQGAIMRSWLAGDLHSRASMTDEYAGVFFTAKGEIRAKLAGKAAIKSMPEIDQVMLAEANRLEAMFERLRSLGNWTGASAILRLGIEVVERYESMKSARAKLDYDDLIHMARALLSRPGIAPWVLYKLDGGIDHVLIDEAQDTSPEQWRLVVDLTAEFFAGMGTTEKRRTLFAVGDSKQSIFSFQGAAPQEFRRLIEHFRSHDPDNFDEVALNVSFRSSEPVLRLVDEVFDGPAGTGVRESGAHIRHLCQRSGDFGEVRLWPIAKPVAAPLPEPWAIPTIIDQATIPESRLAQRIADEIRRLIGNETTKHRGKIRPLDAGDFLVLVRNRTPFVDLLVRALKERSIAVAGADRMHVLAQIAVMDLLAFANFLLLPDDDLNLATLLRSPLIGLTDDELFELCAERKGRLWPRLREAAPLHDWARSAHELLEGYLAKFQRMTPHELFADLLGRGRGRKKLYARLGPQCGDAIDEFLSLALLYEMNHAPTLQGFLAWVESGEAVLKRDLETGADQVRIMTVHGAKGLQAPVVFLCDQRRQVRAHSGLFWFDHERWSMPLWSPNKASDGRISADLRAQWRSKEIEEENRLLYVAMTRAEERLYVCGWSGQRRSNEKSWHDHIADALGNLQSKGTKIEELEFDDSEGWDGAALRFQGGHVEAVDAKPKAIEERQEPPSWLYEAAPSPPQGQSAVSPSLIGAAQSPTLSPLGNDDGWRFKRGNLIHHLLELLPGLAPNNRAEAGRNYLRRPMHNLDPEAADEILRETLAVIDDPATAHLFGEGSMAEVPVTARWKDSRGRHFILNGRIDRLWVGAAEVWAIDFKSNRPAPMRAEHVSREYRTQLAAYRHALLSIYPDKVIRCFLLWSDGPRLMEIPPGMLDLHD